MKKGAGMAPRGQGVGRESYSGLAGGDRGINGLGKKAGSLLNLRLFLQYDEIFKDMTVSGTVLMLPKSL